jgi:hypothetical protein
MEEFLGKDRSATIEFDQDREEASQESEDNSYH